MTQDQADGVAKFLADRMDNAKTWSINVTECRPKEGIPPSWRVVIECAGSHLPVAIYSARVLTGPKSKAVGA